MSVIFHLKMLQYSNLKIIQTCQNLRKLRLASSDFAGQKFVCSVQVSRYEILWMINFIKVNYVFTELQSKSAVMSASDISRTMDSIPLEIF